MVKSESVGKHTRRAKAQCDGLIDGSDAMITFSPEITKYFRQLEEAIRLKLPEITKAFPHDELLLYDLVRECGSGSPMPVSEALWKLPSISSKITHYSNRTGNQELDDLFMNIEHELQERGKAFVTVERQRNARK